MASVDSAEAGQPRKAEETTTDTGYLCVYILNNYFVSCDPQQFQNSVQANT